MAALESISRLLHSQGAWKPRRDVALAQLYRVLTKKDDANDRSSKLGTEGNPPRELSSDPQRAAGVQRSSDKFTWSM